jgi:hypothetical protein
MGIPSLPIYGNVDLGSAIETAEAVIAKIKTNKYDNDDISELRKALAEIDKALTADEA